MQLVATLDEQKYHVVILEESDYKSPEQRAELLGPAGMRAVVCVPLDDCGMQLMKTNFGDLFKYPVVVFIQDYVAKGLSQEHMHAILLHEEGHVVNDFSDENVVAALIEKHSKADEFVLIYDLQKEINADAYAAKVVGGELLHDAIREVFYLSLSEYLKLTQSKVQDVLKYINAQWHNACVSDELKPRFEALDAVI